MIGVPHWVIKLNPLRRLFFNPLLFEYSKTSETSILSRLSS